jgi:ribosome-binding protein aMBF1 (putative translation factor)
MVKTSDAIKILKQRTGIDPETDPEMLRIAEEYRVGQIIHDARIAAQLTQKQLADAVGTRQSVISQLEDAEYEGHSLSMLRRITEALKMRVHIELIPDRGEPQRKGR